MTMAATSVAADLNHVGATSVAITADSHVRATMIVIPEGATFLSARSGTIILIFAFGQLMILDLGETPDAKP